MFRRYIHHRQCDGYKSHTIFKNLSRSAPKDGCEGARLAAIATIWTKALFQYLQNHQDLYHSKIQLMRYLSPVQQCESGASFSMQLHLKPRKKIIKGTINISFSVLKPFADEDHEACRNSFYCRTIKEWNSLPSNVVNIEENPLFQKALRLDQSN